MEGFDRTLIIGDIHGDLDALNGALIAANFDITKDRIICVGDYVDGQPDSFEVVRTLLEIKNQSPFKNVFLLGNHDAWFYQLLKDDLHNLRNEPYIKEKYSSWYNQGGKSTYDSYVSYPDEFIKIHKEDFFAHLRLYHQENNILFIHAGFHVDIGFLETLKRNKNSLLWDRSLYRTAYQLFLSQKLLEEQGKESKSVKIDGYDKIFIGHTPTLIDGILVPTPMANIINVDQGCKKNGILTVWELESGNYYQHIPN